MNEFIFIQLLDLPISDKSEKGKNKTKAKFILYTVC